MALDNKHYFWLLSLYITKQQKTYVKIEKYCYESAPGSSESPEPGWKSFL
jgi:hypothetical protein